MKSTFLQKSLFMLSMFISLIVALLLIYNQFRNSTLIISIIWLLLGVVIILVLLNRDTYLPFLGESAFPCDNLIESVPLGANFSVTVKVPPNVKVSYWAADPENNNSSVSPDPWVAYKDYSNSGVTVSDQQGNATLRVRFPQKYRIPWGATLNNHVHYRYCKTPGMLSSVFTVEAKQN
jgi:hypothetical protein